MAADAIPLTSLEGASGKLRHDWLEFVTADGVAPRTGATRKLAYPFAYYAHKKTFEVFPSIDTLASHIALGSNSIRAAYRWFIENGWLIQIRQGGGRALSNKYVLSVPASWFDDGPRWSLYPLQVDTLSY